MLNTFWRSVWQFLQAATLHVTKNSNTQTKVSNPTTTMASHVTVVTYTIAVVALLAWGPSTVHCDHLFAKTAKENEHLALEAICKRGEGVFDNTSVIITQVLTLHHMLA